MTQRSGTATMVRNAGPPEKDDVSALYISADTPDRIDDLIARLAELRQRTNRPKGKRQMPKRQVDLDNDHGFAISRAERAQALADELSGKTKPQEQDVEAVIEQARRELGQ